ncbi:MAG: chlorophyll synthase ChlG [Myxococcota bacterium]
MQHVSARPSLAPTRVYPSPSAVVALLKPITWFPPMWALACGFVSVGRPLSERWPFVIGAIILAGPLLCGTSQAINDWFDRDVDAINEPHRPIPSGRVPGRWGLGIAIVWTVLSLTVAYCLGLWIFAAATLGMFLAWAYSAPPFRLKSNGWWGNSAVGLCYEGLPWFTGAAALAGAFPNTRIVALALLYSAGAFGIMILNDFKALEGDRAMGVRTLPIQLGVTTATRVACTVMAIPQLAVLVLLLRWQLPLAAALIGLLLTAQLTLMVRLTRDPRRYAAWYNATGTTLSVLGMMVSAVAIRGSTGGL